MLFDIYYLCIDVLSDRSLVAAQNPEWDEFVLSPSKYWRSTAISFKHKQLFPIYDFVLSPSKYWRATAISLKKNNCKTICFLFFPISQQSHFKVESPVLPSGHRQVDILKISQISQDISKYQF